MESDSIWQFILLLVLLILSALFSSSETSLLSLSKIKIRNMMKQKVKGAKLVQKLVEDPNKLLGTILVGNNIVNITASAIATSLAISYFGKKGVTIATIAMTIVVLIFGEITPKSYAAQNPEKVALKVSKVVYASTVILNPITRAINYLTGHLIRLMGGNPHAKQSLITEEELKTMINISHEEGILENEEHEMIRNVFELSDIHVRDVMIPRTDVSFVNHNATYKDVIEIFKNEQFSRLPVQKENSDNIIGILYIKDLLFIEDMSDFTVEDCMKEPYFAYEYKLARELFEEMRNKKIKMTIILDEYGGTSGIVTIEDIVEEVFGEINDEYDTNDKQIEVTQEGEYIVDGRTRIDDINDMIGTDIDSEDYDTISGFIISELGYFPEAYEILERNDMRFEILEVGKNRIKRLKIIS